MAPRVEAVERCTIDRHQPVDQQGGSRVGRPTVNTDSRVPRASGLHLLGGAIPAGHRSVGVRQIRRISPPTASWRPLPYRSLRRRGLDRSGSGCAANGSPEQVGSGAVLLCDRGRARGRARPGRSSDRPRPCGAALPGAEGLRSTAELPSDIRIVLPGPERGWGFPLDGRGSNSTVTPPTGKSGRTP